MAAQWTMRLLRHMGAGLLAHLLAHSVHKVWASDALREARKVLHLCINSHASN